VADELNWVTEDDMFVNNIVLNYLFHIMMLLKVTKSYTIYRVWSQYLKFFFFF